MKKIILSVPPTDNQLRMPSRRQMIKTKKYRTWIKEAEIQWRLWKRAHPDFRPFEPTKSVQLEFVYSLYLKDWRTDLGNYTKALADFLGGNKSCSRLFTDDHFIVMRQEMPAVVDKSHPRVEISPCPNYYYLQNENPKS